ncbi:MAG: FadR/GntR family transcriptional regulator [Pararhodobacter sp.]
MTLSTAVPAARTANAAQRRPDRAAAIAELLQQNILSGHYLPGDRLPSEADLCAHFSVSRPTLREALGRLSALGLIRSKRGVGGGAFVTRPAAQALVPQIGALLALVLGGDAAPGILAEARLTMLAACAQLAAQRRSAIDTLRAEIDQQSDFKRPDDAFHASCQRLYHLVAEASANPALALLCNALITAEFAAGSGDGYSTRDRARYLSFHVRLANGIAGGRPEDATAALRELTVYERDRRNTAPLAPEAEPERPPRMRDLRPPPVQRLGRSGD